MRNPFKRKTDPTFNERVSSYLPKELADQFHPDTKVGWADIKFFLTIKHPGVDPEVHECNLLDDPEQPFVLFQAMVDTAKGFGSNGPQLQELVAAGIAESWAQLMQVSQVHPWITSTDETNPDIVTLSVVGPSGVLFRDVSRAIRIDDQHLALAAEPFDSKLDEVKAKYPDAAKLDAVFKRLSPDERQLLIEARQISAALVQQLTAARFLDARGDNPFAAGPTGSPQQGPYDRRSQGGYL